MNQQDLNQLIDRQKKGHALENDFYAGAEIYQRDIERIFMRVWLYTGHQSEIPNPGDFFLYEMAGESVIISHGTDGEIRAMMNVCRHRGSHVCWEKQGNSKRFTCPYHGWTYSTDGQLVAAAHMNEGFDKSTHGLKQLHIRVFFGMIFINFAAEPSSFDVVEKDLSPLLKPFRLDQAKVAHRQSYPMKSNWKLAVENYKECYHCAPAHMEYARAHSLALPQEKWQAELDAMIAKMPSCGLHYGEMNHSYTQGAEFGADRAFEHYPLLRGHVTGSKDGKQLAPLLGDITDFDGGAHDFKIGPVLFALAYCDHVMLYSF
ncbi:MAG TPA: aromatic ring-hydroxylating dioxygenase subunit alpha, partial [Xanthomonadales bacterium]|nr:aromatic ring-hydroxylating dioxygenase subunit alpha [Xanthomonadales bacterium]